MSHVTNHSPVARLLRGKHVAHVAKIGRFSGAAMQQNRVILQKAYNKLKTRVTSDQSQVGCAATTWQAPDTRGKFIE